MKNVDLHTSFRGQEIKLDDEVANFENVKDIYPVLKNNIAKMKFSLMTPIQKAVVSSIREGHDVMGCSATGSGKTIAFLFPILNKMLNEGPNKDERFNITSSPIALIIIPTRELAEQIFKEARKLLYGTGINVVKIYGGVPHESQIRELKYGSDVLVATPGRLLDFLRTGAVSLSCVKYFIIDEADRILDMGFEPQLNSIVYENDLSVKEKRQNLMFSATFDDSIKVIARKFMNEFYFIQTNIHQHSESNIKQVIVHATEEEKMLKLHNILQTVSGSIISKQNIY